MTDSASIKPRSRTSGILGLSLAGLLALGTQVAWADYKDGAAAAARGDYETALQQLQPLAKHGDPLAQVLLGTMYRRGLGVPNDAHKAASWYRKAAEQGLPQAQVELGHLLRKGAGVVKNQQEAVIWYQRAAEQNLSVAQVSLLAAYFHGQGVAKDLVQAHKWFSLALDGISVRDADLALARKGLKLSEQNLSPKQFIEATRLADEWRNARY